ncbi:MAG: hypothetical protein QOD06_2534 [Candidatus Binatota bacterium]|nr:hypothetical protein [Candidatus Binatota bacterium]
MGFSFPLGLLALVALAVLVWIYLRERRQRPIDVASLLLWEPVREEVKRGRFRPDLLFWLQALLLAALALGLAEPYRVEESAAVSNARTALVFDVSTSMQAAEGGARRFDLARDEAREVLAALEPNAEVMAVAVGSRARVIAPLTRDRGAVAAAIETLEPTGGLSRLAFGVQLARAAREPGSPFEIDVFTDLPESESAIPLEPGERLRYFRVGTSDRNVAVTALRVYQNPFEEGGGARAYALVRNFSASSQHADLGVTLGGRPLLSDSLDLGARETRVVPIRSLPAAGRLEARLNVGDALEADDRAIAFVRPFRPLRVLAVTRDPELAFDLRALNEAVPAFRLRLVAASDLSPQDIEAADVAIYHGFVPTGGIQSASLFVYPPADGPLFPSEREVVDARILDWNDRHPLFENLRYVEALPLKHARQIALPEWGHPLITSQAGGTEFPLAFAGEVDGRRVMVFAFDLSGHSIRESENLSVLLLLLNAIRWLVPPDPALPVQVDVGQSYRETLPEAVPVRVSQPNGDTVPRPATRRIEVAIDQPGEYEISLDGTRRAIYANLFDADESDIGRPEGPTEVVHESNAGEAKAPQRARVLHPFGSWMYAAALAVLVLEWLVAGLRKDADEA